jgi:uncharacterized protein
MMLEGVVTNVAAFGAFVDIGVHQDGLVHVSAMANRFVKDPHEIVKPGQVVRVKVMEVDLKRQRISLTMRLDSSTSISRRADTHVEANAQAKSGAPERRPQGANKAKPEATGAIALALERAKLKK